VWYEKAEAARRHHGRDGKRTQKIKAK